MYSVAASRTLFVLLLCLLLVGCSDESALVTDIQETTDDLPALVERSKPHAVPFKGRWTNTANPPVPPEETPAGCQAYFTTSQVGRASHMGNFTGTGSTCAFNIRFVDEPPFNFTDGAPPFFVADFTSEQVWTAANGDQLFVADGSGGTFVQSLVDGSSSIRGMLTFSGGTGRFDDAVGEADVLGTGDINGVDQLRFRGELQY